MKRLLLLPLLLVLASCSQKLDPKNYSFEITDKVISSTLEKNDEAGEYASCDRKGKIAWDLNIKPDNFSGLVIAKGTAVFGEYDFDNESFVHYFQVGDGEMLPQGFSVYGSWSNPKKMAQVCAITEAKQYVLELDPETVVMIPGVKPSSSNRSGASG